MSEAGLGGWFGAFLGDRLVGDLGIFRDADLGRYQSVKTHPDHRRKGVCSTLVYESAQIAFNEWGIKDLVIAADPSEQALAIYRSLGFETVEQQIGLEKS
jgi:ribosomal protein S18 acetylase RimI-like enzyme